ncbi:hypothetical protein [Cryobacterium sp. PAMC25264]|uniref:hypothetical protein n=1 Tax=Cryobacterium sp. PAMC25264 TaxID=2861288 RepID=UPI001C636F6D|nr:hypothetical protein [Cryobacterium sp. PAMC25264]QYF72298.1 hypothetical protein KY500_10575 [Cryobacterium sp. PAMC25264]
MNRVHLTLRTVPAIAVLLASAVLLLGQIPAFSGFAAVFWLLSLALIIVALVTSIMVVVRKRTNT